MKSLNIFILSLGLILSRPEYVSLAASPDTIIPAPVVIQEVIKVKDTKIRKVTAYNLVEGQTDKDPCIGAANINICPMVEAGDMICAANFVPFYTVLEIEGIGRCLVLDRMNSRYPDYVDIAMPAGRVDEALQFGVRDLDVGVINK